jgi:hypothetical protein
MPCLRFLFTPRPESGRLLLRLRSRFPQPMLRKNRRTHATPDSSLSLSLKATAFRSLAHRLRLRCSELLRSLCASVPPQMDDRSTPRLSVCATRFRVPVPRLVMFSNPFFARFQPLALTGLLPHGAITWRCPLKTTPASRPVLLAFS